MTLPFFENIIDSVMYLLLLFKRARLSKKWESVAIVKYKEFLWILKAHIILFQHDMHNNINLLYKL